MQLQYITIEKEIGEGERMAVYKQVISRLNIGPTSNPVALVQYSDYAGVEFFLNTFRTKDEVLHRIVSGITYQNQETATDLALLALHQDVFTLSNGARAHNAIPQLAVLFTDGYANNGDSALYQAAEVHARNITLISVGIGSGINDQELIGYASHPRKEPFYIDECYLLRSHDMMCCIQGFSEMAEAFAFELEQRSCTGKRY
ncbi:matrilin-2-like [Paramacrobiotus metropolitanus]|uniref:matrilin-2-like n=1 Tax=Paramacrobiotus metropolitanus TaxID=2943436 RepID=UPI0024465096|nr:matrilin-2-like [Paramacrobiotus metropolitanus]